MGGGGSYSHTHTYYEPDKVKAAQIEADAKIKVAKMEQESIVLKKEAMKELLEMNAKLYGLMLEAQYIGFEKTKNALLELTKELNYISEQRFVALEQVNLKLVSDVNRYYGSLNSIINEEGDIFMQKKLPDMLKILSSFDENSTAYKMYQKSIDELSSSAIKTIYEKITYISEQQKTLIDSTLKSKEDLGKGIQEIIEGRLKHIELQLQESQQQLQIQAKESTKMLQERLENVEKIESSDKVQLL